MSSLIVVGCKGGAQAQHALYSSAAGWEQQLRRAAKKAVQDVNIANWLALPRLSASAEESPPSTPDANTHWLFSQCFDSPVTN
jgi:Tfp pilus assembly protein PilP